MMRILVLLAGLSAAHAAITVSLGSSIAVPLTGRFRIYFSLPNPEDPQQLPINENADEQNTNQVFAFDATISSPGDTFTLNATHLGYPLPSIADLPPNKYLVQSEFVPYVKTERKDLPPTFLPSSCVSASGSNGAYAKPDGTITSAVHKYDSTTDSELSVTLSDIVPNSTPLSPGCAGLGDGVDSEYIKTFRITSNLLTEFYNGEEKILEACVLLPEGHSSKPDAKYPLVVAHGHYSPSFNPGGGFRETAPDCDPDTDGYACLTDVYSKYLHGNWTATTPDSVFSGGRVILVTLNHPVQFFDDSYAVNSETMGPYGDAIVHEMIPAIEKRFQGIGEGWARGVMGGSTGGWESAMSMIKYPDEFGYALAACPDSVSFSHHTSVDMYNNRNAYYYDSNFKRTAIPGYRDGYSGQLWGEDSYGVPRGAIISTAEEMNRRELVMGESGRSCGQWDAWEAVFSPVDEKTGFPKRAFDKLTGEIDKDVVEYWRENFDLAYILTRDWDKIGEKVRGKLHFAVGGSDSFYLTNGVYDFRQQLEEAVGKDHGVEFVFGAHDKGLGFQHCFRGYEYWEGDEQPQPNSITRLTYVQDVVPRMVQQFLVNAEKVEGADVTSWRY